MTPYLQTPSVTVHNGDCLTVLPALESESVHCCVTSPPYYGLRDYGTGSWEGGDEDCDHKKASSPDAGTRNSGLEGGKSANGHQQEGFKDKCGKCGARRIDQQIGLEPTPDEYVAQMVRVFAEVRRVLRDDGTLWLNLGDSYAGAGPSGASYQSATTLARAGKTTDGAFRLSKSLGERGLTYADKKPIPPPGLKPKDLIGIPWAVAKALQAPYYAGRIAHERDRAWLAATVDAEGSICGFIHERKDDKRTRTGLHITITNSSTLMLDEASRIFPASRYDHQKPREGHLGKMDTFRWVVQGVQNKLMLIREIYPHLIVKKRQAVLAYNLLLFVQQGKSNGQLPVKDEVNAKRAELVRLMSAANHGQPIDIPSWCVEPPSLFEPGWYLRSDIIWHKPNPMPESVTDRPTKSHEYLFLLSKSERYHYDAAAVAEPSVRPGDVQTFGGQKALNGIIGESDPRYRGGNEQWGRTIECADTRNRRSVWTVATKPFSGAHFATFPPDLIKPCVLAGCPAGGVVLDPFGGAGTTALVASENGCQCVLVELNPEYCAIIAHRLSQGILFAAP